MNRNGQMNDIMGILKSVERDSKEALGVQELPSLQIQLMAAATTTTQLSRERFVLSGLNFQSLPVRQSNIHPAHMETFEWIFESSTDSADQCVTFREWLQKPHDGKCKGIYWIAGKAGSGKSTLMKFLNHHPQTKKLLEEWAEPHEKLIIASYYFWHAGLPLQKSQEGLLRSLLYEILRVCPELIPVLCPERWELATEMGFWSRLELFETLKRLGAQAIVSAKFCFLVDGLDEYEGDHSELVQLLDHIAAIPNIKLCVSSRPWEVFKAAYDTRNQHFYLQDLTRHDIETYVRDLLEASEDFTSAKSEDPRYGHFVSKIMDKAQGVFLWVVLVVRSLLQGLRSSDTITLLESRLDELPNELESLFRRMLDSVEKIYKQKSERTFKMALAAERPLSMIAYSLLDEDDTEIVFRSGLRPMSQNEISRRKKRTRKQINVVSNGLLEVSNEPTLEWVLWGDMWDDPTHFTQLVHGIDFLHRTVREFLLENQSVITPDKNQGFQAESFVSLALLWEFKCLPWPDMVSGYLELDQLCSSKVIKILCSARQAELVTTQAQSAVLDELERSIPQIRGDGLIDVRLMVFRDKATSIHFLPLCVATGLTEYVKIRISRSPLAVKDDLLEPALLVWANLDIPFSSNPMEMVQLLLDKGADPNKKTEQVYGFTVFSAYLCGVRDRFDAFPLMREMREFKWLYHFRILDLLLQYGADPNVARDGDTIWGFFVFFDWKPVFTNCDSLFRIIQSFIDHGANPNLPWRGSTIWEEFLDDLYSRGDSATDLEEEKAYHYRLVEMLVRTGAKSGRHSQSLRHEVEVFRSYFDKDQAERLHELMLPEKARSKKGRKKLGSRSNIFEKLRMKWSNGSSLGQS